MQESSWNPVAIYVMLVEFESHQSLAVTKQLIT